jgi:hypothetical protein
VLDLHVGDRSLLSEEALLLEQLGHDRVQKENVNPNNQPQDTQEEDEVDLNNMSEEQVEAYLCKEYGDWLNQTEEKVGPAVTQALGVLCERMWGKLLLNQEKKKEMQEGICIPSNCRSFKAPKLNSQIYIRIHENAKKKDEGARTRQVNMARAAIPLLYSLGEMDAARHQIEGQARILSHEPRDLEEAKQIIAVLKKKNDLALQSTKNSKTKVSKSFQLLNYNWTETTRKRRQDVCEALGSAFKPYGLESEPPSEHLFTESAITKMKSELKAIKPKVDGKAKNGHSSTQSRRSSNNTSGKNNNYPPSNNYQKTSSNNSGNYNNNNPGQQRSKGNGGGSNTKKSYGTRSRGRPY